MLLNAFMIATGIAVAFVSLRPRVLQSAYWRATVTPLASIIGSGFLIAGPIISHAVGNWAWLAMAGLCAVAWGFGMAIRFNIANVEPLLEKKPPTSILSLERASDLSLAFAYFVSVAYYLNLFGAFTLRGAGIVDETGTRIVAAAFIGALGLIGLLRGLRWLEHIEIVVVGVKLAMIAAVIAALAWSTGDRLVTGAAFLTPTRHATGWDEVRILLGLVILVQGFETSRYLGSAYDVKTRIATMRYAQLLSSVIYVGFILLMTPWLTGKLPAQGGETAIIDLLTPLSILIAPVIIAAALASQLSAGIADMNGAGGLIGSVSGGRVPEKYGYLATALAAIAITWSANIFEIINYASKAFVLYYTLQSVTAARLAYTKKGVAKWRAALFVAMAVIGTVIVLFSESAEGG